MTRMSQSLPDSGGAYFDVDSGGVVGVVRRNVGAAFGEIQSGDAGGKAVGFAVGLAVGPALAWAAKEMGLK